MPRIVNNRICYSNHNVVLDPSVHKARPDYVMDVEAALTPNGNARLHQAQLDSFSSIPCWAIELPTIAITNSWLTDTAASLGELPTRMQLTATLHNGNYEKVIFVAQCNRSESFQPLYIALRKAGISFNREAQCEAEFKYFAAYNALVAAQQAAAQ